MTNMSSISCATTCGRRLPVSARKVSRAAPSATRVGASYPQYVFRAAAISAFTSRITQQLIGRATERRKLLVLHDPLGIRTDIAYRLSLLKQSVFRHTADGDWHRSQSTSLRKRFIFEYEPILRRHFSSYGFFRSRSATRYSSRHSAYG